MPRSTPAWLPASFRTQPNNTVGHPLLPTNGGTGNAFNDDDDDVEFEMERFAQEEEGKGFRERVWWYRWYTLVVPIGLVVLVFIGFKRSSNSNPTPNLPPNPPNDPAANAKIDFLLSAQSSSLPQAISRYRLRNNREPPPNFPDWFDYARNHSCLIDEYEQVERDFAPFYQLAEEDKGYFKRMMDRAADIIHAQGLGMTTGVFENSAFKYTDGHGLMYTNSWPRTFGRIAHLMPNMSLILNGRDEPRVLFNPRKLDIDMKHQALSQPDPQPFAHSPAPTDKYFRDEMGCVIPNAPMGFTEAGNDASAFMLFSSSAQFTTGLFPVLSTTKVSPCFSDILVPSEFYYSDSEFAASYTYPDNVPWSQKDPRIYWRGSSTGGHITGDNYHRFPRFRLVDISCTERGKPLMDVALSAFHEYLCGAGCNAHELMDKYGMVRAGTEVKRPREDVYRYKYLMDVDGNSFSGRYIGLLKSGSLVFKSTIFTEPFTPWLRPFEHYIPVLPDLSDLLDKIDWARNNNAEACTIQQAGKAFAERVLTDAQFDCYFALVMLEWGRLQASASAALTVRSLKSDKGSIRESIVSSSRVSREREKRKRAGASRTVTVRENDISHGWVWVGRPEDIPEGAKVKVKSHRRRRADSGAPFNWYPSLQVEEAAAEENPNDNTPSELSMSSPYASYTNSSLRVQRREEGWSGEWVGGVQNMDAVLRGLRSLKVK